MVNEPDDPVVQNRAIMAKARALSAEYRQIAAEYQRLDAELRFEIEQNRNGSTTDE